jgi:hypothetical protein
MHSVKVELLCLTGSPMTEIAKDTALQSQVASLLTQTIGKRHSSLSLASSSSSSSSSSPDEDEEFIQGDISTKCLLVEDSAEHVFD